MARFPKNYFKIFLYCTEKEHFNFLGKYLDGTSQSPEDFVLSFKHNKESKQNLYILRTKYGNKFMEFEYTGQTLLDDVKALLNGQKHQLKEIAPVIHPLASDKIDSHDKRLIKKTFTFGIIYQKFGQVNSTNIFTPKIIRTIIFSDLYLGKWKRNLLEQEPQSGVWWIPWLHRPTSWAQKLQRVFKTIFKAIWLMVNHWQFINDIRNITPY